MVSTWNLYSPATGDFSAAFWNNPYFVRYKNFEDDSRYRTFGNGMANYKVFKGFDVVGRVAADSCDEMQKERLAVGSTTASYNPNYSRYNHTYREFNDKFSLRGVIGASMRRVYDNSLFASTNGGLVVPEPYSLLNSASPINAPTESVTSVGVDGLFASATFGYRERIFLDLTARRDKSTTLPIGNNASIYPSAALGYVFPEDLADKTPWLSHGKIRANYAQVGSSAQPLGVNNVHGKPAVFNSQTLFAVPSTRNNPDLRPEKTRSAEVGLKTAFLQNRLGLGLTLHQRNSLDQIIPVAQSASSGYLNRYLNSGNVRNRGIEIAAYGVPVRTQDLNWRIAANWSRNENIVISLPVDNVLLASYQGGATSNATVGKAFGSLRGSDYVMLNGQRVVGTNGYYLTTDANQVIGGPNPRRRGGSPTPLPARRFRSTSWLTCVRVVPFSRLAATTAWPPACSPKPPGSTTWATPRATPWPTAGAQPWTACRPTEARTRCA